MILKKIREILLNKNIQVYIIPRTDQHNSQYLSARDKRISYLSGFTGSNAIGLISQREALVWTDSRYFLQAKKQLRDGWNYKKIMAKEPTWFQYVRDKYTKGQTNIGIDARLIDAESALKRKQFFQTNGFKIDFMDRNIVDEIWEDRPPAVFKDIYVHQEWSGKKAQQKVDWVRQKIREKNGSGSIFTDLSEITWLLNLRSSEIPYNPFFKGMLIIKLQQKSELYLPQAHPTLSNPSSQLKEHLQSINVQLKPYPLKGIKNLLCKKSTINYHIYSALQQPIEWQGVGLYRAQRTPKEQEGFRNCHERDAIAMIKFWTWRAKQEKVGEYEAAAKLDSLRKQLPYNKGLSFRTISAGGPNGAIVHYAPKKDPDFMITKDMIHLVDSGGQYLDGTTDVTRAFHFGIPTKQQKDVYTRVLLGNLDLQRTVWPKTHNMTGSQLDVIARRHLWGQKLDYGHGTGHGVGNFQSVHQGPCGISKLNNTVFVPGMIVSNQPGYYKQGAFGIRIQNLLIVVQDGDHYKFQCLTLCPYDVNLINQQLLSQKDIEHINDYHRRVYEKISPHLKNDWPAFQWLHHVTRPINASHL